MLSGGGAKGLAHLGVIKALEENNIPIDYVVGTSMGAIVGAFYAAGYSPEEIEEMVVSESFQNWVNGRLDKNYNYYFHSKEPNASFFNVAVALDSSLNTSVSTKLARDLTLNFALAELLCQASETCGYNFDSLFIPFRACASEIFTQQNVVLKSGNLSDAVRASMTVPFLYNPIKIDDQYLFDGGIYNNFPVDIAVKEFGPDYIIGSNVSEKVFTEYPSEADDRLINNSLFLMLLDKSDPTLVNDNGLYIEPNLKGYTAIDFKNARAFIDSGYVATIRRLEDGERDTALSLRHRDLKDEREKFRERYRELKFHRVELIGFSKSQETYLRNFFKLEKRQGLTMEEVKKAYYQIISEDFFGDIYPRIYYDPELKAYVFELSGRKKRKLEVDIGGNISSRSFTTLYLGAGFKTFTGPLIDNYVNLYSGRLYQSVSGRSRLYFPSRSFIYLQPNIAINRWDYANSRDVIFTDAPSIFLKIVDRKFGFLVGFPFGIKYKGEIFGDYFNNSYTFSNTTYIFTNDVLDKVNFSGWRAGINLSAESLNRKQYASEGHRINLKGAYYTGLEKYNPGSTSRFSENTRHNKSWLIAHLDMEKYFKVSRLYSFGWQASSTLSNQPFFSNYYSSLIMAPAFYPLIDSRTFFLENFRAHSYVSVGLKNIFRVKTNIDFRLEGYAFMPFRKIVENDQLPEYHSTLREVYLAGTAALVYHSPVGPLSLNLNYYDQPRRQLGFYVSLGYLIFNKGSMD